MMFGDGIGNASATKDEDSVESDLKAFETAFAESVEEANSIANVDS